MRNILIALIALVILNIADAFLTGLLVIKFGYIVEANPIMKNLMEIFGIKLWAIFKIVLGTGALMFVIKRIQKRDLTRVFKGIVYGVLILYSLVVVNNLIQVILFV
jgi:hypothetical protein